MHIIHILSISPVIPFFLGPCVVLQIKQYYKVWTLYYKYIDILQKLMRIRPNFSSLGIHSEVELFISHISRGRGKTYFYVFENNFNFFQICLRNLQ